MPTGTISGMWAGWITRIFRLWPGGTAFHVECKRAERFNAYAAMEQAQHDANGHAVPVVMHRRNRKPWLVVMRLQDFLPLLK